MSFISKKISVIVPVYNVEKYLANCLKSLVNQSLKDFEVIIVNDGSTDNSQKIIDEFSLAYPAIIRSFYQSNSGVSQARNFGLQHAVGDYIGFVDSDDWVECCMFENLYMFVVQNSLDIGVSGYLEHEKSRIIEVSPDNHQKSKYNISIICCNKIYRRLYLKMNKIFFRNTGSMEDVLFNITGESVARC